MKNQMSSLFSGAAAALSASCCVVPLLLLTLGATNLSIASKLMHYRPFITAASILLLAGAFYSVYRPSAETVMCKRSCSPRALRRQRWIVWTAAGLMMVFMLFSYLPITITMSN
jgi:mercuric ion transport protein